MKTTKTPREINMSIMDAYRGIYEKKDEVEVEESETKQLDEDDDDDTKEASE